jgi:hypothetical protein
MNTHTKKKNIITLPLHHEEINPIHVTNEPKITGLPKSATYSSMTTTMMRMMMIMMLMLIKPGVSQTLYIVKRLMHIKISLENCKGSVMMAMNLQLPYHRISQSAN